MLNVPKGILLSDVLKQSGLHPDLPCGGNGLCRKCLVRVSGQIASDLPPTSSGLFRSCHSSVIGDCTVYFEEGFLPDIAFSSLHISGKGNTPSVVAAVDIGTTTIAVELYDSNSGSCISRAGCPNPQISFGADVITRAGNCSDPDSFSTMTQQVRNSISDLILKCLSSAHFSSQDLSRISVTGNCIMTHLFTGLNPVKMSHYPYQPVSLFGSDFHFSWDKFPQTKFFIAPSVSPFIGGDAVCALMAVLKSYPDCKNLLLADIGTNGEILLLSSDRILACSTAAGPAFEGAGISCGMRAEKGAISSVDYSNGILKYETICHSSPSGICGTGLIDSIAAGLEMGIIDSNGRLLPPDEVFNPDISHYVSRLSDGNIAFSLSHQVHLTADDVRSYQLAKAAIASGLALLPQKIGLSLNKIDLLCLSGGFGTFLRPYSAVKTGLIPFELEPKCVFCGNAALTGAAMTALDDTLVSTCTDLSKKIISYDFENNEIWLDEYLNHIPFPHPNT